MNKINEEIKTLGERIILLLSNKEITAYELAKEINVSQSTINRIIRGETKRPNSDTINLIANHLQVNAKWLKTGKGQMTKSEMPNNVDEPSLEYNSNNNIIQKLINSLSDISESVRLNAIANERNSKSMEKMIEMISKKSIKRKS